MKVKKEKKKNTLVKITSEKIYEEVKEFCNSKGYFIGEYFTEAAKEKLQKEKK